MSAGGYLLVGFVVGGLLGWLFGWLYARGKSTPATDRLVEELRHQGTQREAELAKMQEQLRAESSGRAAAEACRTALESRLIEEQADSRRAREALDALSARLVEVQKSFATVAAQLETERKAGSEKQTEHSTLTAAFDQLRARALVLEKQNGELSERARFLDERLATERSQLQNLQEKFAKDFEAIANKLLVDSSSRFGQQSVESLDKLLGPLRENLQDFKGRLESVHRDTVAHSTLLKDQIGRIGTEAANLSKALKGDVKVLGNWGENMLDLILEKSGLQIGVHYRRQSSGKDPEGEGRFLDVVIDLPDQKHLVIDSKVSLKAYEEHVNSGEPLLREQRLAAHCESIRSHIRGLGAKRYQDTLGISAPDFVLMYIPIEAAFFSALGREPSLFSEALDRNVVLTTNSTLLATLRTVAHVWRLADQQKYALEIADRGGKLYDKFVGFLNDLQEIGKALDNSQRLLGDAFKKLHTGPGNLTAQADKLKALGVKASKSLPPDLVLQAKSSDSLPIRDRRELPLLDGLEEGK